MVGAALEALRALEAAGGRAVEVEQGGAIGLTAEREMGTVLPETVAGFCEEIFEHGGAVLTGPGSGRYVYDLRRRLGLFLKISPVQIRNGVPRASTLRPEALDGCRPAGGAREPRGHLPGQLQSSSPGRTGSAWWSTASPTPSQRCAASSTRRRGSRGPGGVELAVIVKQGGLPDLTALWGDCAELACASHGVELSLVDVDLMAYRIADAPRAFDVIAAPNLFGDVLGDLAAVALGSRGLSFGASYNERGDGVYQTNHGAAYDIAGSDRANPVGQILSLAMMLRESLGLTREARALEEGVRAVWREGGMTADLGGKLGTAEMGGRVGAAAAEWLAAAPE